MSSHQITPLNGFRLNNQFFDPQKDPESNLMILAKICEMLSLANLVMHKKCQNVFTKADIENRFAIHQSILHKHSIFCEQCHRDSKRSDYISIPPHELTRAQLEQLASRFFNS